MDELTIEVLTADVHLHTVPCVEIMIIIASELVVSSCFKVIKQKLYKTTYTESTAK